MSVAVLGASCSKDSGTDNGDGGSVSLEGLI